MFGGGGPIDPATGQPSAVAADPTGKGRGFFITLRITSPLDQAVEYIEKDLQDALKTVAPTEQRPNLPYAVRKVWILQRNPIKEDAARLQRLQADYQAIQTAKAAAAALNAPTTPPGSEGGVPATPPTGGRPGGFPPYGGGNPFGGVPQPVPGTVTGGQPEEAYNDRLTGESILEDKEFELVLAVELDPATWTKPAADPNAPQQTAAAAPAQ
jgi:hypothetical protein